MHSIQTAIVITPVRIFFLIFCSLWVLQVSSQTASNYEYLNIHENADLKIVLKYAKEADISQPDWLQLLFWNKTAEPLMIEDFDYSIHSHEQQPNGEVFINHSGLGRGNKYEVFDKYHHPSNPSNIRVGVEIASQDTLSLWRSMTNKASVLLNDHRSTNQMREVCGAIICQFSYRSSNGSKEIETTEKSFCFHWLHSSQLPIGDLTERLRNAMATISNDLSGNAQIIRELMQIVSVASNVSNIELIEAILLRESINYEAECMIFLAELEERNTLPNEKLTYAFLSALKTKPSGRYEWLYVYWDNSFLEPLYRNNNHENYIAIVLDAQSRHWATHEKHRKDVFKHLSDKLNFNINASLDTLNLSKWSEQIKLLAVSRDLDLIKYLQALLYDTRQFQIEDWTRYKYYGMLPQDAKPDIVSVRICDAAFVALLRALDQIQVKFHYNNLNQETNFRNEILDSESTNAIMMSDELTFNWPLRALERHVKLTDERLEKTLAYISTLRE